MDVLEEAFEIEQISFSRLDGGTKMAERQDLIDQYYADESIQVSRNCSYMGHLGTVSGSIGMLIHVLRSSCYRQELEAPASTWLVLTR